MMRNPKSRKISLSESKRWVAIIMSKRPVFRDLKTGLLDMIIATHRLLSDKLIFRDLGFLIIDEEHRFGVVHKEKIKQFKAHIDVLTMTATPIPRTLNMALSGLR